MQGYVYSKLVVLRRGQLRAGLCASAGAVREFKNNSISILHIYLLFFSQVPSHYAADPAGVFGYHVLRFRVFPPSDIIIL